MDFRSENKVKIEGGMSTMTDLVFLLLIFFIVISTLITAGVNIDVEEGALNRVFPSRVSLDIRFTC